MKIVILLLSSFLIFYGGCITKAELKIVKYQPLSFQLLFSQNITLPSFQILVDNNNLEYIILNSQAISSQFLIEVTSDYRSIDIYNTEGFSLVFNYPLDINYGQLYIGDFVLFPQKTTIYIKMMTWTVYLIFVCLLICSLFGIISLGVIDFIEIYILTQLKFRNKTSVIETFSQIFFFVNSQQIATRQYLIMLVVPNMIILGCYLFGTGIKLISPLIKNHFMKKRIIKFFSYNLFLTVWTIFLPSVIFKSFLFINDYSKNIIQLTSQQYAMGIFFTYLNFVNFLTYIYILYIVLNPRINQTTQNFYAYLKSPEFQLYNKFHRGLHLSEWTKRNIMLFITVRKVLIVLLFFVIDNIAPAVIISQLIGLFFTFTIRPYREWFYTNLVIVFNLLWFFFYIFVLQGFFYFDISRILQTRSGLTNFMQAKSIIFTIICSLGIAVSIVEGYRLLKNLKYQFKQQSQVKSTTSPVVMTRGRLYTETSEKMAADMKQSLIFDCPASPVLRKKKNQAFDGSLKTKLSLFQVQMDELSSPSFTKRKISDRIKKKWKDKSLLQQLATN